MKALRTQFDGDEFAGVVATPTCSSSCCCSCCAATVVGASVVGAVTVATTSTPTRSRAASIALGTLAVLIPPGSLVALIGVASIGPVNLWLAFGALLVVLVGGYTLLFSLLRGSLAVGLALGAVALLAIAFVIELFLGAPAVASGYWYVYLLCAAGALVLLVLALRKPWNRVVLREAVLPSPEGAGPPVPRPEA